MLRKQCGASVARVVYKMLTLAPHAHVPGSAGEYKVEYDPLRVNEYQKQYKEQQVKYMRKRAAKFGYQLVPA